MASRMTLPRRSFITVSAAALAFAGLSRAQDTAVEAVQRDAYRSEVVGYGPLVRDPAGLFDLPQGFSYTVVSQAGRPMSDGLVTPHKMDGMACFGLGGSRVALVRNHELKSTDTDLGAFGKGAALAGKTNRALIYDHSPEGVPFVGGTTTVIYDLAARRVEAEYMSLLGTAVNCAGGPTPRATWLSCEETLQARGPEAGKDHGWVFEVPIASRTLVEPHPIVGMGRFRHEATATDPRTGIVYLTEDMGDGFGLFYRYLPKDPARLLAGGRLQALGFRDGAEADARNWDSRWWRQGDTRPVVWVDLDGVDNPYEDLRYRGHSAGAAWFARGEGIFFDKGELYFTCTSGGPGRLGQIMRYRPSPAEGRPGEKAAPGRIQLFLEPTDKTVMQMCDNIAVAPWGHLFVCEDKAGGVNYLRAVSPGGKVYTVGRNPKAGAGDAGINAELAGVCFSPDGSTMFVNVYLPGLTVAVTGPWRSVKA
jgi:uncharacterized protein